jgi:8-oxo-dGTP pyrophosphatase MutT (NUDIX family)
MSALLEDVRVALADSRPGEAEERFEREAWLALLTTIGAPLLSRERAPSHLTASAAVLSPDGRQTCLVLHHKLQLWVQPGGHLERTDASVLDAAAREVLEETGLSGRLHPLPVLLSRHRAPCAPGVVDWHLDLQFLLVTEPTPPRPSDETPQVAWWPVNALPQGLASGIEPLIARATHVLAQNVPAGGPDRG